MKTYILKKFESPSQAIAVAEVVLGDDNRVTIKNLTSDDIVGWLGNGVDGVEMGKRLKPEDGAAFIEALQQGRTLNSRYSLEE